MVEFGSPLNLNNFGAKAPGAWKKDSSVFGAYSEKGGPNRLETNKESTKPLSSQSNSRAGEDFDSTMSRIDKDDRLSSKKVESNVSTKVDESGSEVNPSLKLKEPVTSSSEQKDIVESNSVNRKVSHEAAMELFLNDLQEEVGVQPEELVVAFTKLSEQDLNASPEKSANALIAALNLDEKKSQKALDLYNQMLSMSAIAGMSQFLQQNGQQAQLSITDKKDFDLSNLRTSLDQLNDRFFMNGNQGLMKPGIDQQAKISAAYKSQAPIAQNSETNNGAVQNNDALKVAAMGAALKETSDLTSSTDATDLNSQFDIKEVAPEIRPQIALDSSTGKNNIKELGLENVNDGEEIELSNFKSVTRNSNILEQKKLDVNYGSDQWTDSYASSNSIDSTGGMIKPQGSSALSESSQVITSGDATGGIGAIRLGSKGDTELTQDEGGTESSGYDQISDGSTIRGNQNAVTDSGKPQFMVTSPQPTSSDVQNNIKEVISKAQFLAQKGGGEMKIALNPQGMGEVNLKVKMIKGNVSVEMITENNEVKKILERGLSDLKESLATHKLNLESIKIDHSRELSQNMDQQQHDLERGFQQKFLNDFSDRNNGMRREMFEFGSATGRPESQTRDRMSDLRYQSSGSRKSSSSRRLDLVA